MSSESEFDDSGDSGGEVDLTDEESTNPQINPNDEDDGIRRKVVKLEELPTIDPLKAMNVFNTPVFEDVTLMINSKIPFLIHGDALILYAVLQKDHKINLGGQYLHIIYFCERFLETLLERGGNFILVFSDEWKELLPTISYIECIRLSVYKHFERNTKYRLLKFRTFHDKDFSKFLDNEKARCVLLDIGIYLSLVKFYVRAHTPALVRIFEEQVCYISTKEILFFLGNDLPCIDLCELVIGASTISSYNLHSNQFAIILFEKLRSPKEVVGKESNSLQNYSINCDYSHCDARKAIVVIALSRFLADTGDIDSVKLISLYYASLDVLRLEHRCCPIIEFKGEPLEIIQNTILKWINYLSRSFEYCVQREITLLWDHIGDLWQGTLFGYIYHMIEETIDTGLEIGHFQLPYEEYVQLVARESNSKLEPYPIRSFTQLKANTLFANSCDTNGVNLYLLNNTLIRKFCGTEFQNVQWQQPYISLDMDKFDEIRHWHCRKPLTDEGDRIPGDSQHRYATMDRWEKRRVQKEADKYAAFLNIYGHNLEGRNIKSQTVICQSKNEIPKQKKVRKKVSDMIEKRVEEKKQVLIAEEKEKVAKLKNGLKKDSLTFNTKIDYINMALRKLTTNDAISKAKMLILHVYREHVKHSKREDVNIDVVKSMFVTIKSLLSSDLVNLTTEKEKIFISKALHELNLEEIAQRNNLPSIPDTNKIIDLNWIRFQLQHLGAQMKRMGGDTYDDDVGFTPDPWQSKFIDSIRKRRSALVVAPTSSGKTFAAYYCMKRVLQESEDGIVVYVAPTKALVNQVEATVYSRFKNVKLKDGSAVVGVFTRDNRRNLLNSRILVTVPQCLDILLLSPRRYTWLKKLRYAIFDEIHKLSSDFEGLVWERCLLLIDCPFLALSATISDVSKFHNWLINNQNFKREQDRLNNRLRNTYEVDLIEHSERHSDLIKYVFDGNNNLQHYHPYCAMDAKTIREHNGIPSSIKLSPSEVLQLYDTMIRNDLARNMLSKDHDILNFFSNVCKDGFITRYDVTRYEKLLAQIFCEVHEQDETVYLNIIRELTPENTMYQYCEVEDISLLLNKLAERNMLPCIVFSYNRNLIERANRHITRVCYYNERESVVAIDRKMLKAAEKKDKMEKKAKEKEEGSNRDVSIQRRANLPSGILRPTNSKFKGQGITDSTSSDIQLIERRLSRAGGSSNFIRGLPYGIAYHHAGLNNKLRSTVEILFRMGILKVIFATGTLALGIHMPCKTVVVFDDSPFLNSLEYHQMSGRAGRRGFDTEGNVIFMGLTKKRHDALMTEKLPSMIGNFPISVTLVARLLLLVTKVTDRGRSSDEITNITISRVLTLLENSLLFQFKPNLKVQIKHFVEFAAQLLFIQGIYASDGTPLKLAGIVNHLHYHEPANLVFVYLLRSGALRKLLTSIGDAKDKEWMLIVVISHLFARLKLHKMKLEQSFDNSIVILEPLPDIILKAIYEYNKQVRGVFQDYFITVAKHLAGSLSEDSTLPVSKIKFLPIRTCENEENPDSLSAKIKTACTRRIACSNFVALSGNDDTHLYTGSIISNIRHEICPGINVVPLLDPDMVHNSYAADFYRHGIVEAIVKDNGLKAGNEFTRLKDFLLVLKSIVMSLEELEPVDDKDLVYRHFRAIHIAFEDKFRNAFGK